MFDYGDGSRSDALTFEPKSPFEDDGDVAVATEELPDEDDSLELGGAFGLLADGRKRADDEDEFDDEETEELEDETEEEADDEFEEDFDDDFDDEDDDVDDDFDDEDDDDI